MPHIYGHIECGSVGDRTGENAGLTWPFVDKFIVAYKLEGDADQDRKLHRRIHRIMREMAWFAQDIHGGPVSDFLRLEGDYHALIVGSVIGQIPMEPLPVHTDGLFTYAMNVAGMEHAEQSYIKNELDIMRYRVYSLIYDVTGGEIHRNSYHND